MSMSNKDRVEQLDIEKLLAASQASGTVHVSMDPVPRISLFYDRELSEAEASLSATSLQKVAALTFAVLGLDTSVEEGRVPDKKLRGSES